PRRDAVATERRSKGAAGGRRRLASPRGASLQFANWAQTGYIRGRKAAPLGRTVTGWCACPTLVGPGQRGAFLLEFPHIIELGAKHLSPAPSVVPIVCPVGSRDGSRAHVGQLQKPVVG